MSDRSGVLSLLGESGGHGWQTQRLESLDGGVPDFSTKFDRLVQPMVRYLATVRFLRSVPTSKPRAAYPGSLFRCIRASTGLLAST